MGTISYIWRPAKAKAFKQGRGGHAIQSIILHSSCGHKAGDLQTLTGNDATHMVSAHWYVDKGGTIYHLVDNASTAYHAGVVTDVRYSNACSLGVEQEHMDGQEAWPDAQVQATARLCLALIQRYGSIEIAHHADVASPAGRKTDPVAFPSKVFWAEYHRAAAEEWGFGEVKE